MDSNEHEFKNERHALLTGMLLGLLKQKGIEVYPIVHGHDYTPRMTIVLDPVNRVTIEVQ